MINLFEKINKSIVGPSVYSLVIGMTKREFLYIGVHFSLDEAYAAACEKISEKTMIKNEETMAFKLEMWNNISVYEVIAKVSNPNEINFDIPITVLNNHPLPQESQKPSIETCVNDFKKIKNILLARLIDEGDPRKIEKMGSKIITTYEKRFVLEKITNKNKNKKLSKINPAKK